MLILQLLITAPLLGMAGILLLNWWSFPRLGAHGERTWTGEMGISFLVPARNEAGVIGETVARLLAQPEADEVIVLDDHSTDGTAEIARAAAGGDPRLRVIPGADLPSGWLGKNWACHQLAQAATGDLLIFTDADVAWQPGSLAALLAAVDGMDAEMLTVWPTQQTVTWGERLVVPLMALVVHAYLPIWGVHHSPYALFAAANGQCIAIRRRAYDRIGGHAAVRDNVLEDVTLARLLKAAGLRLRMVEGNHWITCRMYRNWPEVRDGYAKNILKGYGSSLGLIAATLFHWLVFLGPWALLAWGAVAPFPGWPWWPLGLAAAGIALRMLTAAHAQQPVATSLLLPLSVLLMTRIAAQALWWQWRHGGPLWKGRVVGKKEWKNEE